MNKQSFNNKLKQEFAEAIQKGLQATPKSVSSKYLYDDKGSRLFEQLMDVPEYYPATCEHEILRNYKDNIASLFSRRPFNVVELGAGDGRKTLHLLKHFQQQELDFIYQPVDISQSGMDDLRTLMKKELPDLKIKPIIGDYYEGMKALDQQKNQQNLVLFLGSTMGNFNRDTALHFLNKLKSHLKTGDYGLFGFDLKKDINVLLNAYNDPQEVTSRFNLNLLERINRELGGHFDISQFQHYGLYDPEIGAIKSYILSRKEQSIPIDELDMTISFEPWEPIHIEVSHKFTFNSIEQRAREAGFTVQQHFTDSNVYFADSLWKVEL